ncbi:hypothetical protein EMIT0P258_80143 [Pseudomonas sp. IT-P258]
MGGRFLYLNPSWIESATVIFRMLHFFASRFKQHHSLNQSDQSPDIGKVLSAVREGAGISFSRRCPGGTLARFAKPDQHYTLAASR